MTATITRNKVVLFNKQAQRSNNAGSKANLLLSVSSYSMPDKKWWLEQLLQPWKSSISTISIFLWAASLAIAEVSSYGLSLATRGFYTHVRPRTDVSIMDGALTVSILKPGGCKIFGDYTAKVYVPHIEREHAKSGSKSRHCVGPVLWQQSKSTNQRKA